MSDYILNVKNETAKLDWAFPFQRTGAFPLDRSSLFSSYEDAVLYAQKGADERGLSGSSYVGQTIAVYDSANNEVTLYVIQPNRSLQKVGAGNNSEELIDLIDDVEALKANTYTKQQTDVAIATAISNVEHLSRKIVDRYEDIDPTQEDAHLFIYMVPNGLQENDDKYDEYIVIDNKIEKVGSWEINLDNYATKEEVNKKVDIDENARLITLAEAEKLSNIENNAQANIINSISEDFSINIDANRRLELNNLPITKVTGLQDALNGKVDAQEGHTLLSPDDQKKLAALVIGENNNLEISGTVNANNVQGLSQWITNNASKVEGLSEVNFTETLAQKLTDSLFISSIDTSELKVQGGQLSIVEVDADKISGLTDLLNTKANKTTVVELEESLTEVIDNLNNFVLKSTYNSDIDEIRQILTWQNIV